MKLPCLLLGYWSTGSLSKLSSVVGKSMYIDKITADIEIISFARVLAETDISYLLPDSIEIHNPTGVFHQAIVYDWKPRHYLDCMHFAHNILESWRKETRMNAKEKPLEAVQK